MISIKLKTNTSKKTVELFLEELNAILTSESFDIDNDFVLIQASKRDDIEHSTPYLMLDLNYDVSDIVQRLLELQLSDFSEALPDKDDSTTPFLFVFGKYIENRIVYIKLKIRKDGLKKVLCISFHYAEREMEFPFAS